MNRLRHVMFLAMIAACLCLYGCKPSSQPSAQSAADETPASGAVAEPQSPPGDAKIEGLIVAMGDSLTAGLGVPEAQAYPAQLEQKLRANGYPFQVLNAGVSGETSSGALTRTAWMLTLKPDIVILETGANDGLRGVNPSLTLTNIDAIVNALQAQNVVVVLAGMQMVRNLGEDYTKAFTQVYAQVAQRYGLIHMPFFLEGVGGEMALNQDDGIHPTVAGYEVVTQNLYPYVTAAIQKLRRQRHGLESKP